MKTLSYLPGLNALRLYAALSVLVIHIPVYAGAVKVNGTVLSGVLLGAWDAVTAFFVLSGYLVTTLLLREQRTTGTVDVKAFYIRRTRRIWPLYYAVVGVTLLLLPVIPSAAPYQAVTLAALPAVVLLSAHIPHAFTSIFLLGHLWSIGVEEWFYVAWPVLVKHVRLGMVIATFIVTSLLLALIIAPSTFWVSPYFEGLKTLIRFCRFECMAIGALGAWLAVRRSPALRILYHPVVQFIVYLYPLLMLLMAHGQSGWLHDMAFSVAVMLFMLNISTNPRPLIRLEAKWLRAFGPATYGVYMLHPLVITVTSLAFHALGLNNQPLTEPLFYGICIAGTLAAAWVSYHGFEARFWKQRNRYAVASPLAATGD